MKAVVKEIGGCSGSDGRGGGDSGGGSKISPDGGPLTRVAVKAGDISEETSAKTLRKNHSSFHIPICFSFY